MTIQGAGVARQERSASLATFAREQTKRRTYTADREQRKRYAEEPMAVVDFVWEGASCNPNHVAEAKSYEAKNE